jgi:hypothetical protein
MGLKKKSVVPLLGTKFAGCPAHNLTTIPTELSWIHNIIVQYFITNLLCFGVLCPAMIEGGLIVNQNSLVMRY